MQARRTPMLHGERLMVMVIGDTCRWLLVQSAECRLQGPGGINIAQRSASDRASGSGGAWGPRGKPGFKH